jgi:integrase
MRVRLTAAVVAKVRKGKARAYLWDTEVPGLGLVVHPTGKVSWVYQGSQSEGRRVTLTASGLAEARKVALGIRSGFVPLRTAQSGSVAPETMTVGQLMDRWLAALSARPSPPVSMAKIGACVDNHIRPRLGAVLVRDLSRVSILDLRDGLAGRGLRGMANQTLAYLRAALRWAEDTRLIPEFPRWRVSRLRLGRRRAHALSQEEWRRMLEVLRDPTGRLHPIGRTALTALALTGCRKSEIAELRWSDLSPGGILLTRHNKTSTRSGPKLIEVSPHLLEVFAAARETASRLAAEQPTVRLREALLASPYVFPSIGRNAMGKPIGRILRDTWLEVRAMAGLPRTMTIHGLRSAFITQAQRLGVPLATVAAMVGHESPMTTLRYYTAPTSSEVAEGALRVAGWISGRGCEDGGVDGQSGR